MLEAVVESARSWSAISRRLPDVDDRAVDGRRDALGPASSGSPAARTPTVGLGAVDDGPPDRMLGAALGRGGEGEQAVPRSSPSAGTTSVRRIAPWVSVPVLSNTTMSTFWLRSRTSPPLMRTPRAAPRPVPTMIAVGVARPERAGASDDEHGDGRDETLAGIAGQTPPTQANVSAAIANTTGTKTPAIRSASCCTGALVPCASSTRWTMWARAVSAPTAVASTVSTPSVLMVAPATMIAGCFVDRNRLAGQHRLVDRRATVDHVDRRPEPFRPAGRGGWSPDAHVLDRHHPLRAVGSTRIRASLAPSSSSGLMACPARLLALASKYRPRSRKAMISAAVSK